MLRMHGSAGTALSTFSRLIYSLIIDRKIDGDSGISRKFIPDYRTLKSIAVTDSQGEPAGRTHWHCLAIGLG